MSFFIFLYSINSMEKPARELSPEDEDQLTCSNNKIKGAELREEPMDDKMEDGSDVEK